MNNKLINYRKKTLLLVLYFYRKKIKKNKLEFGIVNPDPDPLFPEVDPDPHKNEADSKHCLKE